MKNNKAMESKMFEETEPILVIDPLGEKTSRKRMNIAPFLRAIHEIDYGTDNPMKTLEEFIGAVARTLATANLDGAIVYQHFDKDYLVCNLFYLEEGLKRSTQVHL